MTNQARYSHIVRYSGLCICFFLALSSACVPERQRLPVTTPRSTPETPATPTVVASSPTATLLPTPIPADAIHPETLKQVRLLHQYWLTVATEASVDPYEMDISVAALSPDGALLAVGGCSKPIEEDLRSGNISCDGQDSPSPGGVPFLLILDASTEEVIAILPENEPETVIADVVFTPDGERLIYAVHPGRFAVWDIESGEVESILWEGETSTPSIAISPDGRWIALKPTDQVLIWDTASDEFVAEIPAYFRPQFSADSSQIAVYREGEFIVYEAGTWNERLRFGMPCECIYALSLNLTLLATSERTPAESLFIKIWDTSTGVQVQTLQASRGVTAFLVFSPDGRMLWRADQRGELVAWDPGERTFLAETIGGVTPIFNLHGFKFSNDGRYYLLYSDLLLGLYGLP
jgi:WD40 repeat protein